jgi:hypothetical protein
MGASSFRAFYTTRQLKRRDAELRWAWVAGKRVQQRALDRDIALDNAILQILGERTDTRPFQHTPPELRSAVAWSRRRLADAEHRAGAAEAATTGEPTSGRPRPANGARRSDAAPQIQRPDPEPIRRRRDANQAKRAELEAEIQALATHVAIESAMQAAEVKGARRRAKERQDAAEAADQAARERRRAGRKPTSEEPEHTLGVTFHPNGSRDVVQGYGQPTPEQIAKGNADG